MFDWFWNFLYLITKSIFRLIDGLISCTNMLCGIEPIIIDGEETDLVTWLIQTEEVYTGFATAAIISLFLVVFFSIWGVVKAITAEKPDMTPTQVCMKTLKAIGTFLFIPACMIALIAAFNAIGKAMYSGTSGGSTKSLGTFLVGAFAQDALKSGVSSNFYLDGSFDYTNTSMCWNYFDLSDFDYFYSWVSGIGILFMMAKVLFIFVDRLFSIIILYIISPIPIATSVIDDGEYFKAWRDQIISKFVVGYCAIIGINIYAIVISKLAVSEITFFSNGFLNFLFKIVIILGGTFALDRIVTLVGNIFGKGKANEELQAAGGLQKGVGALGSGALSLAKQGAMWAGGGIAKKIASKFKGGSGKNGNKKGADGDKSSGGGSGESGGEGGDDGNKNPSLSPEAIAYLNALPQSNNSGTVSDIISGNKDDKKDKEKDNKNQTLGNAIKGLGNGQTSSGSNSNEKKEGGNKK